MIYVCIVNSKKYKKIGRLALCALPRPEAGRSASLVLCVYCVYHLSVSDIF